MDDKATLKNLFYTIYVELGGTSIERELNDDDYSAAFNAALQLYRARSRNSVQEGWILLRTQKDQQTYTLPPEVDNVTMVRRLRFSVLQSGGAFDPFTQAFFNSALRGTSGNSTGLLSYQTISMYEKTVGRLFGEEVMFEHNVGNGELFLWRKIAAEGEVIGIQCSKLKDVENLLRDHQANRWLRLFTKAGVKEILGEKYGKFAQYPGAQGGTTLRGEAMITEAKQEKVDLEDELTKWGDGGYGPTIHIS